MRKKLIKNTFCLFTLTLSGVLLFFLIGCQNDVTNAEKIEPIDPTIEVSVVRYDQLLNELSTDDIIDEFRLIQETYPAFTEIFVREVLNARTEEQLLQELLIIKKDSSYIRSYSDVQSVYPDLQDIKPLLAQGLENFFNLFDMSLKEVPDIYTFISGFTYQSFLFEDVTRSGIGIGLDMFLGSDFPYAKINPANPSFSSYLVRSYNKDHIVKKVLEVLVEDVMNPPVKSDFLNLMIWGGKKLYLLDEVLNFIPDTVITEYSSEQLKWCGENETQMWNLFFEKNLFFESDIKKFNKLIGPAPTSPGMPPKSPGGTANYMGWQIVESFMKRNPAISAQDLIRIQDAQEILEKSKYKPRR